MVFELHSNFIYLTIYLFICISSEDFDYGSPEIEANNPKGEDNGAVDSQLQSW